MERLTQFALMLPLFAFASCAAHQAVQPKKIPDLRGDIERCPVHGELLIEATNRVDFERGSYMYSHYQIRKALFPCAFDDPHSVGKMAIVTYCPKCRAAKRKYLRDSRAMTQEEIRNQDVDEFIERQRRELDAEYSNE